MADEHATLALCGMPPTVAGIIYSTTRKRTLYGITGKPEMNEVDW